MSDVFKNVFETLQVFLTEAPLIFMNILMIMVLMLSWSSNHNIKELIANEMTRKNIQAEKNIDMYNKIIKFNIKSQVYKEDMYSKVHEIDKLVSRWRTLAEADKLMQNNPAAIANPKLRNQEFIKKCDQILALANDLQKDIDELNAFTATLVNVKE